MSEQDGDFAVLASKLLEVLEQRGVPQGVWLVDLTQARVALSESETILESALVQVRERVERVDRLLDLLQGAVLADHERAARQRPG